MVIGLGHVECDCFVDLHFFKREYASDGSPSSSCALPIYQSEMRSSNLSAYCPVCVIWAKWFASFVALGFSCYRRYLQSSIP